MPRPTNKVDVTKIDIATADKATLKAAVLQLDSLDTELEKIGKRVAAIKDLKKTADATLKQIYARLSEL